MLEVFYEKGVLKNFTKFTGKHLCQSLFFDRPATLLKKRLWVRCFLVNLAKFLRTPFLQNTSGLLLLRLIRISIQYPQEGLNYVLGNRKLPDVRGSKIKLSCGLGTQFISSLSFISSIAP